MSLNEKSLGLPMTSWINEKLFHDGDTFFSDIFNEIRNAKRTLHIEIHYMDDGALGKKFSKEVLNALNRGIKIFIIVDGMSPISKQLLCWMEIFKRHGGQITFFHPLPWRIPFKGLFKINQRSHKKVILIDMKIAYLGSFNIDTRQMSKSYGGEGWRDIGIKISGSSIKDIYDGFIDTWRYCHGISKRLAHQSIKHSFIRLNHIRHWRHGYFKDLLNRLENAQSNIWITNPYFVPDFKLTKALERAKQRGVDVKILVPQKSDLRLFPLINSLFYRDLVRKGVEIYEYKPSILHAKIMIIDDWIMMGSSNLNSRTQRHDLEIDVVISQKETKSELISRFYKDLTHSHKLTYQYIRQKFSGKEYTFPIFRAIKYFL